MQIKNLVSLILAFLLMTSSFTVVSRFIAIIPTSVGKPDAEATSRSMSDSNASDPPIPLGVKVNINLNSSVQYVNSSGYFYVEHGFYLANWSSLTTDIQSAFLDPEQTNFTLQTSAPDFQNPPLTHFTDYDSGADAMSTLFFFQFNPGDVAPGNYSFTGTWSSVAIANPPNYTAIYAQNTVTLVVLYSSLTLVSCSPNPVSVGSPVTCTATVFGFNVTGTLTWSTSSIGGSFSQPVCTLSSGNCSTTYTGNNTGYETITASYSGDSNNLPSIGSTALTVFVNLTTGANVTVYPTSNLGLTFANITAAGVVVANETPTVQAPSLANATGQYYVINVTASYTGNVTVSLAFDGSNMTQQRKSSLQMMQYTPILGDVAAPFGMVDMKDIAIVAAAFGSKLGDSNWNPNADLNNDGKVDMKDIAIVAAYFGNTAIWANITTYVDTTNNVIYGDTTHFSFIGIH